MILYSNGSHKNFRKYLFVNFICNGSIIDLHSSAYKTNLSPDILKKICIQVFTKTINIKDFEYFLKILPIH